MDSQHPEIDGRQIYECLNRSLEPILLGKAGDTFTPSTQSKDHGEFVIEPEEYIGMHSCGGGFSLISISNSINVILCDWCCKRIELPKSIDGSEKLRQWCASNLGVADKHTVYR